MAKKNYAAMADGVIRAVGGEGNIANVTHCMTRLRLQLVDSSKLDEEGAKKIPGILNLIIQNGEYQFVVGQDVPSLYEEMTKREGIKAGGSVEDPEALKADNVRPYKGEGTGRYFLLHRRNFFTGNSGVGGRGPYRRGFDLAHYFFRHQCGLRNISGILCN